MFCLVNTPLVVLDYQCKHAIAADMNMAQSKGVPICAMVPSDKP